MRETIVKTTALTKRYRKFTALDSVDMTVCSGDIYGLIGRNGAGKTTFMKIITNLTDQTSGEYELFGKKSSDTAGEKRRIGCLIENPAFFGNMTAWQNLRYYCYQKGITDLKQIDKALELVSLTDARNKKFRKFSLGMKQRLGIAFALLDNPDLVILDEPINGLDPIGISELRETFLRLNKEHGITFIISSHILSELYAVANRFMFLNNGRMLKEISKEELDLECSRCTVVKTSDTKHAVTVLENELNLNGYKVIDNSEIRIYSTEAAPDVINQKLVSAGVPVSGIFESGVSLEDYFKTLIGEVSE